MALKSRTTVVLEKPLPDLGTMSEIRTWLDSVK